MRLSDYEVMTDCVTKFHRYLRIAGWFHHDTARLEAVRLVGMDTLNAVSDVELPHGGVEAALGPNKGFQLDVLRAEDGPIPPTAELVFTSSAGDRVSAGLLDLCRDRLDRFETLPQKRSFMERISAIPNARMLDIGGRARSKVDRSLEFPNVDVTVLDVLPGDNVDVVADAHELSRHLPAESFDAFYSVSVFEHLLMPWKVAVEINRVLKPGGFGLISTHQTLGLHDMPWDFWRFSDTAWDGLFNAHTGFKITDRVMDSAQFVLPFIYRPNKVHAERSAGFEASAVIVEKIGPCRLDWPLNVAAVTDSAYPDVDDGYSDDGFPTLA